MIPIVVDADTLFGTTTRGLLIHMDYGGLFHLHWSPLILDEMAGLWSTPAASLMQRPHGVTNSA